MAWSLLLCCCTGGAAAQYSGGFGTGGARSCIFPSIVLPVEMLWMEATCETNTPTLSWATATERNSSHFLIDRSGDAATWETVGRVQAAGHSQQIIEYTWRDDRPRSTSITYYRLRQVDLDGREEVFATFPIENCTHQWGSLFIHPNPGTDRCTVRVDGPANDKEPLRLIVSDALGKQLRAAVVVMNDGQGIHDLNLQELAPGAYRIILTDAAGNMMESAALVKQ